MKERHEALTVMPLPVWLSSTWLAAGLNTSTSPVLGPFLLGLERKTPEELC